MGVADTFHPTPVGVLGGPVTRAWPDVRPFFGGASGASYLPRLRRLHDRLPPRREERPDEDYLYLAEQNGATVLPMTTVTRIKPRDGAGTTSR